MTRWLQPVTSQIDPCDKTDKTDNTVLAAARNVPIAPTVKVLSGMSVMLGARMPRSQEGTSSQPMAETAFPHSQDLCGNPKTWTGLAVTLDAWRGMSDWDRHGSTGKVWNGLTRAWEPSADATIERIKNA